MGNQTSSQQKLEELQEQHSHSNDGEEETGQTVSLTQELERQIANDFKKDLMESQHQFQQQHERQIDQRETAPEQDELQRIHKQLDEQIMALTTEFSEGSVALENHTKSLLKEYVQTKISLASESPCLEERNKYISCQKQNRECDAIVEALQNCVGKEIAQ